MSVAVTRQGAVAIVTIDRPEAANALDAETIELLGGAFTDAGADPLVRCVVLTATGDRVFCAGMDLTSFARGEIAGPGALEVLLRRFYPKPTIAAVNGTAAGGGFELALACDLVVAAEHARFGLPEVRHGLVAGGGGTRLPRRLPLAIALELGLTGDLVDAQRALALGLVNRVVPASELLDTALALAARVCANAPLAVAITKKLMYDEIGQLDWERFAEAMAPAYHSQDAAEAARAFAEKRPPRWMGR